ncbi:hypothetical protein LCGC14_1131430 [marine sediment metagenome]|uniref:Uncharacterized protein n=1 Tax=marine sediment metagenome TaxID=412755 RepID=A0A0F9M5W1_9ZZZZ
MPDRIELFDRFWLAYPRKEKKKQAFTAFKIVLKSASFDDLMAKLAEYKRTKRVHEGIIQLPTTWLRGDPLSDVYGDIEVTVDDKRLKEMRHSLKEKQAEVEEGEFSLAQCASNWRFRDNIERDLQICQQSVDYLKAEIARLEAKQ